MMYSHKIFDKTSLFREVKRWKLKSEKIVFTNGCFDLLHPGHIYTLTEAKALGTKLIAAVNSDNSVKRLKGPDRPIQNEEERVIQLAALTVVDAVVVFDESTPLELIELVLPDVLVKGGDWDLNKIVGADVVKQNGGQVINIPLLEGYSTTVLIDKIRKASQ
jgi:rfaE bifunctional protein nucleotidyltransferase chain/domain